MTAQENTQDGNVGNLGDILKHAALVQLARVFSDNISTEKYYLDSHSYLYHSNLASSMWQAQTQQLLKQSLLYKDYIDLELPYIEKEEYLCSSGLINSLIPDAHLLLCETNRQTREWLLQQLADKRVSYHTVKEQMLKWVNGKSFKKLPSLLALIDPFELTEELWESVNQCLGKMTEPQAPVVMLAFDHRQESDRHWPSVAGNNLQLLAQLSYQPYHLAVYSNDKLAQVVAKRLDLLAWDSHLNI